MDLPYEQYFEAMPCYLTVQDRDFKIIKANQRFRNDFGDYEGRHCYQVYKHRSEKCEVCPVERTFQDGERHGSEEIVRTLDGREVTVIVYTTPIRNEAGEITSVMEMSTDVTEIKLLQKQARGKPRTIPLPLRGSSLLHLHPGSRPHGSLKPIAVFVRRSANAIGLQVLPDVQAP